MPSINDALIAAAKSGVKVSVTVASLCSFGRPTPSEADKLSVLFTQFDQAGIDTRLFTKGIKVGGKEGYRH